MRKGFQHTGRRRHPEALLRSAVFRRLSTQFGRFPFLAFPFLLAAMFLFLADCKAQENPTLKIDDDITRFAYSDSGRIVYSTRHVFSVKKIELQRDDIWIWEPDGKRHRILIGEKFTRGTRPFSYTVRALRWSTDSSKIAVELATTEMINDDGDTREGVSTLLLDDSGREIAAPGADSVIAGASNAAWVGTGTGEALVYLKEILPTSPTQTKPPSPPAAIKLFSVNFVRMPNGVFTLSSGESTLFRGQLFMAADWGWGADTGVAIQPGANKTDLPHLARLNVTSESIRQLASIEGYAGGLSLSPSGEHVAYWVDNGQLEVRDVNSPDRAVRLNVPLGTLAWSKDETRILVKRGPANRSGSLAWYNLPTLATVAAGAHPIAADVPPQSVLHDLQYRQFDISPDGKSLAVVEPGRQNLLVYPLS